MGGAIQVIDGASPVPPKAADRIDVVELAQQLIRVPSPNPGGDERQVADCLEELMAELGLPRPVRVNKAPERPNLITTIDFGPGGSHLALAGHTDTKPVGDAAWNRDPFAPDVDGDQLYGLGSADMKAALAAMLVAATRLVHRDLSAGRLSLLFTADEEDGAIFGARHVAATMSLDADGMVIGEPCGIEDDFDRLHLVSRGIARLRLRCTAVQGHSSLSDELGWANAGVDAARAVIAIADGLRLAEPAGRDGLLGWHTTVNTGLAYRGGVGYGVLPGRMDVDTEVRLLPGMTQDDVEASFADALETAGLAATVSFDTPPNDWLPATAVTRDHPLAQAARESSARILGNTPADSVFPGTTDATWFASMAGLPVLPALGPGLLRRAHGANEWVSATALRQAADLYEELGRSFCSTPQPMSEQR